jgi:hypothetical protein
VKPFIIEGVNEQLANDVKRYTDRGLSQTAIERKLLTKGWKTSDISQVWTQVESQPLHRYPRFLRRKETTAWALFLFRCGFAGVFLINALVAWLQPQDFLNLMNKSLVLSWLGELRWLIPLIAVNDLLLGLMILFVPKRYRPFIYAWAGLWFLAITVIKLTALTVFTS